MAATFDVYINFISPLHANIQTAEEDYKIYKKIITFSQKLFVAMSTISHNKISLILTPG